MRPPPHEDGPDRQLGKEGNHQVPDEEDEEEPPQIPMAKEYRRRITMGMEAPRTGTSSQSAVVRER